MCPTEGRLIGSKGSGWKPRPDVGYGDLLLLLVSVFFFFFFSVLGIESRSLNLPSRHSTTEYDPDPEMMLLLRELSAYLGGSRRRPMMPVPSQVSVQKMKT